MLYYAIQIKETGMFLHGGFRRKLREYPKLSARLCDATRLAKHYVKYVCRWDNVVVPELEIVEFEIAEVSRCNFPDVNKQAA